MWRTNRPPSPWESLPPLTAPPGQTAIAGRVLTLDGRPLPDVTLADGATSVRTDRTGRFLLVMPGATITSEGLDEAASIRLTDAPEVLGTLPAMIQKQAVAFVRKNREVFLSYWNNEIGTREMIEQLQRVGSSD